MLSGATNRSYCWYVVEAYDFVSSSLWLFKLATVVATLATLQAVATVPRKETPHTPQSVLHARFHLYLPNYTVYVRPTERGQGYR